MMSRFPLLNLFLVLSTLVIVPPLPAEDVPVPAVVQTLVEKMIVALKTGDDAALTSCWHTPETFAKARVAEKKREAAASSEPFNAEKEYEHEFKHQTKDLAATTKRAAQLRKLLTKYFGPLDGLKLSKIKLDEDDDAPAEQPAFDGVDLQVITSDGASLTLSVDDLVKIDGIWKFTGSLDDEFKVNLPDTE